MIALNNLSIFNIKNEEGFPRLNILTHYKTYAASKESDKMFWYGKVVIMMPCVFMVLSILAMAQVTTDYIWFVGLVMTLFFSNVLVHIAEAKSTLFVPLYHFSVALMILIPLITYLLQ